MAFFDFVQIGKKKNARNGLAEAGLSEAENRPNEGLLEKIPTVTKVKIVAALFLVSFSTYIAYWVQQPSDIRTDVIGTSSNPHAPQEITQESDQNAKEVSIVNFSFDPATLQLAKGTKVVWTNKDAVPHTVTSDSFSSSTLNPGQSFSYTFKDEGTFSYSCSFHPQMKGTITVDGNTSAAAGTSGSQAVANSQTTATDPTGQSSSQTAADQSQTQSQTKSQRQPALAENKTADQSRVLASSDGNSPSPQSQAIQSSQNPSQTLAQLQSQAQSSAKNQAPPVTYTSAPAPSVSASLSDTAMSQSLHQSGENPLQQSKITNSGPEDFFYVAALGAILFLSRKKLFKNRKAVA